MTYTKVGPFTNGSASPPIDKVFLDGVETALVAAGAATVTATAATGNATTDTANLQNAITAAQNALADLLIPGGVQSYSVNAGLTWNLARGSLRGIGNATLSFATLATGPALTITGTGLIPQSGVFTHGSMQHTVSGFTFNGPDTDTATVDGILITDTANGDNGSLEHIRLYGFRDGLTYQDNTWLINHTKVSVEHAHRYAINGTMGTNAGENMHYYGCVFGASNAAGTAVALYTPPTGSTSDFFFHSCSFDYANLLGDIEGHNVEFYGCHFEDLNNGPMFTISNTGGNAQTDVGFHGCTFADTNTGTRASPLVVVPSSNTSDRIQIAFLGGVGGVYNKWQTLYQNLSTANPTVRIVGMNCDQGGTASGAVSQYGSAFSQLADGGFESGAAVASGLGGWSLDANSNFYTAVVHSGTYSLRRVGAGTAYQIAPIVPKAPVSLSGYAACNNYTSGSVVWQVQFLAGDRTTVLSTVVIVTISGTQSFTGYQRRLMPPPGASYASVQFTASAFAGTAELDDLQLVSL